MERDAEFVRGIMIEKLFDERRSKAVEPGCHGCMSGEKISRACRRQRDFKWLLIRLHETAGALQHGKGGMALVQVTDIRLDAECGEQSPAADTQQHLLLEA